MSSHVLLEFTQDRDFLLLSVLMRALCGLRDLLPIKRSTRHVYWIFVFVKFPSLAPFSLRVFGRDPGQALSPVRRSPS